MKRMLVDNRLSTFRRGHYQNLGILSTGSSQTEPRNLEETLSIKKFGFKGLNKRIIAQFSSISTEEDIGSIDARVVWCAHTHLLL